MRKTLGLALGAGGARGVAHIGFLQALDEAGVRADYIAGCSMGAVVGALYAAGVSPAAMREKILDLKLGDIASLNLAPIRRNGLMRTQKARNLLVGLMGEKDFSELKIPFACIATDLVEGKTVLLKEGNVADAALASSSIPGVFTPAKFGGYEMLVDGCILERVPTREIKEMGAEIVVAVDVLGNPLQERAPSGRLLNTLLRVIDVMDTRMTQRSRVLRKHVDLWLEPKLGGMDQYQVKDLGFAYEKGYELGVKKAEKIKNFTGE